MFDIAGVAVLVVLIALFGFLVTRAWRLKNGFLKWGGVVVTGLLSLLPALVLVLALIGFGKLNERHTNPVAAIQVAGTAAQTPALAPGASVARGQQLAHICENCHSEQTQLPLSGANFVTKFGFPPVGTFYAPNLTPSGNIKDWTDGEVIRAIREGVHRDGRSLLIMPSDGFRNLSDDDVQALVAYLRSQPPTGGPTPDNAFNVVGALFMNLSDFRTAQQPAGQVTAPQPGTPAYGKYMVDIIGCRGCHGDQLASRVDNGQPGPPIGPNLTKIVPTWTEAQFMTFFNSGLRPDGSPVPMLALPGGGSEPRMPWPIVRASTTDDELKAIYSYLHSLPPVESPTK